MLTISYCCWYCLFQINLHSWPTLVDKADSCSVSSYRGDPKCVLLWSVWEVQCAGAGAPGSEPRGPVRPLWQEVLSQNRPHARSTDGNLFSLVLYICFLVLCNLLDYTLCNFCGMPAVQTVCHSFIFVLCSIYIHWKITSEI